MLCLAQLNRQAEAGKDEPPPAAEPSPRVGRHRAGRRRGDVRPPRGILPHQGGGGREGLVGQGNVIVAKRATARPATSSSPGSTSTPASRTSRRSPTRSSADTRTRTGSSAPDPCPSKTARACRNTRLAANRCGRGRG